MLDDTLGIVKVHVVLPIYKQQYGMLHLLDSVTHDLRVDSLRSKNWTSVARQYFRELIIVR